MQLLQTMLNLISNSSTRLSFLPQPTPPQNLGENPKQRGSNWTAY